MPRTGKGIRSQYDQENLELAVAAVKRKDLSVRLAAEHYKVPKSTLSDRLTGRVTHGIMPGAKPALPLGVENEIVEKIKCAGRRGFGITRRDLRMKVGKLVSALQVKTTFRNGVPGKDWLAGFLKRHPDISLRSPTPLNSVRARMLNPEVASRYYRDLGELMTTLDLHSSPAKIWNIDETNVSLTHKPAKVLAELGQRNVPGRVGNSRDGISVLACINAAGKDIPPLVIVKGQTAKSLRAYNVNQGPPGCKYTFQKKAWMEDVLGVCWFRDHFLKHCGPERPQLVLLDSHSSHESLELLELARANNIELLALPPHTTQYLNPLDKTVFGPFQREYNRQCTDFMAQSPNNMVTKWEWPRLFKSAYMKTFNPENISRGFEVCGVYPFDAARVPELAYAPSQPFDQVEAETSAPDSVTLSLPVDSAKGIPQDCTVVASADSSGSVTLEDPAALFDLILQGGLEIIPSPESESVVAGMADEPVQSVADATSVHSAVGNIFDLPKIIDTPKTSKPENKKKLTSHRLLTSDEIVRQKQDVVESKERAEKEKEERKKLRLLKSEQKKEAVKSKRKINTKCAAK